MNKSINDNGNSGIFMTKQKIVFASEVLVPEKTITDIVGEEHTGLMGDWEVEDEEGYIYFMDKRSFHAKYRPLDRMAFVAITDSKNRTLSKLNEILLGVPIEK